jgi:hypothetical protein
MLLIAQEMSETIFTKESRLGRPLLASEPKYRENYGLKNSFMCF